jgi:biotin synthase
MCGIGPFIPQKDTPFKNENAGTAEETAYYLSIIRLIKPNILLPATTALGTIKEGGRELGILSGANVVMPNLSPLKERSKYALYDNKLATGVESAEQIENLKNQMQKIGYEIVCDRGDINL